jgi:hypothetical protein
MVGSVSRCCWIPTKPSETSVTLVGLMEGGRWYQRVATARVAVAREFVADGLAARAAHRAYGGTHAPA